MNVQSSSLSSVTEEFPKENYYNKDLTPTCTAESSSVSLTNSFQVKTLILTQASVSQMTKTMNVQV